MHAWLDVTAGVAGDMMMGALVDAGADLDGVQSAVCAVAGDGVRLRREPVLRAGLPATKIHVDIVAERRGPRTLAQLADQVAQAPLAEQTKTLAIATLRLLAAAYSRGYEVAPDDVSLQEVAALDVLTDIVGDCEALRLLGVESVTASPLAIGSGRIRTSHGDLAVPVPAVGELIHGWPLARLPEPEQQSAESAATEPHPLRHVGERYVPLGGISGDEGMLTEEPARVVDGRGLGELATPTGVALLRSFAQLCEPESPASPASIGVGAGGRDVPDRPNVVRLLLS
ncbi:MAG: DUF111 family protein [Micropruina sp.]|uniref:nickel insertion protein n=1 Tax=Micropruina sp. TaxID=2737536 RepID=UPI0039E409B9